MRNTSRNVVNGEEIYENPARFISYRMSLGDMREEIYLPIYDSNKIHPRREEVYIFTKRNEQYLGGFLIRQMTGYESFPVLRKQIAITI